ncbi:transmembrane protease serine 9-like [Paramacrobiotus metropolitanus]|uniref:transmembrane protease serine 9-like n=1 Tax=Paramacrobiotus metropolitanus TaxID=2943436 RepID=UPI00244620C5|nr:transmembrane protease serine 9-like [Paramacrobiotus metropolitanus]
MKLEVRQGSSAQSEHLHLEGKIYKADGKSNGEQSADQRKFKKVHRTGNLPLEALGDLKINGGRNTSTSVACWQVFIVAHTSDGVRQSCGGVIIGSRTVLTTAGCLVDSITRLGLPLESIQVIVGALDSNAPASNADDFIGCAETFNVSTYMLHPDYNDALANNDIAILTVTPPIDVDHKPCACILCFSSRQPSVGETCAVTGYGAAINAKNPLQWIRQEIVNQDVSICPEWTNTNGTLITNTTGYICTQSPPTGNPVLGDGGGALVCLDPSSNTYYLAGILAFGDRGFSQNVNVALYLSWISESSIPGDITVPGLGSPAPTITTSLPFTSPTMAPRTTPHPFTPLPPPPPTTPGITEACGIPRNGGMDPFGIVGSRGQLPFEVTHLGKLRATRQRRNLDANAELEARIIGGFGSFPEIVCWQAFMVVDQGNETDVTCGGVILGSRTILTAAACMMDADGNMIRNTSKITVTVGALNSDAPASNIQDLSRCAQWFAVQSVIPHPDFYGPTADNNIGLLILSSPIDLVRKPCACPLCLSDHVPQINETCVMSGYGAEGNANDTTQRTTVPLKWVVQKIVLQSNTCQSMCDRFGRCTDRSNFICSQGVWGQDQCTGDNGGPLFCYDSTHNNYYLAGVIAFTSSFCGAGLGGQSVQVTRYLQWIVNNAIPGDVQVQKADAFSTTRTPSQRTTTTPVQRTTTFPGITTSRITTTQKETWYPAAAVLIVAHTLDGQRQTCGGVIIGSRTVLTTAGCLVDSITRLGLPLDNIQVIVGALDSNAPASNADDFIECAETFNVSTYIFHPDYDDALANNDIAIVTVASPIDVDHKPCVCVLCFSSRQPSVGETCAITGYGANELTEELASTLFRPF